MRFAPTTPFMALAAGSHCVLFHHLGERIEPCRKANPLEARRRARPRSSLKACSGSGCPPPESIPAIFQFARTSRSDRIRAASERTESTRGLNEPLSRRARERRRAHYGVTILLPERVGVFQPLSGRSFQMADMNPLLRRMIEVTHLSRATQQSYVHAVSKFSRYFGHSPDRLGLEDVHAHPVQLISKGISWASLNQGRLRAASLLRRDARLRCDPGADRLCPRAAPAAGGAERGRSRPLFSKPSRASRLASA